MSRIKPALITVFRLTNAAALAAVLILAVRSYWVQDWVRLPNRVWHPAVWVKSGGGEVMGQVFFGRHTLDREARWHAQSIHEAAFLSDDVAYHKFGFGYGPHRYWPTIVLPWWSIAVPLSVWPIWWLLWDRMRWRRAMQGRCVGCGYDLRETTGEACTECGRPIAVDASRIALTKHA